MSNNIAAIIISRTDSKRLPGKALRLVDNKPLIYYVIERVNRIPNLQNIILATTDRHIDDELAIFGRRKGIDVFRGETDNVAHRVLHAALAYSVDCFIRVNGDSPLIDPILIKQGIEYCADKNTALITNLVERTFPYGISVEIIRTAAMAEACLKMQTAEEQEHVTMHFYKNSNIYNIKNITSTHVELRNARMVVDTESDLINFQRLISEFGEKITDMHYQEIAKICLSYGWMQD